MDSKSPFDFKRLKINDEGRYSISRPYEAKQITNYIKNQLHLLKKNPKDCIITDATAGVGGDTLSFSASFKSVNAIEILKDSFKLLDLNCKEIGVSNVRLYNDDCMNIIKDIQQDVLYMDPPWGGVKYKEKSNLKIYLNGVELTKVIMELKKLECLLFLKVPLNIDLSGINIENKYIILNKKELPSFYLIQC